MKRFLCTVLTLALVLALGAGLGVQGATEAPSRTIHVVYDDSGSMIQTHHENVDTWCQAKYAMEVFSAMLGEKDVMDVYVMSDFDKGAQSGPRLTLRGSDGAEVNVGKVHNMVTTASNTPFSTVQAAYQALVAAPGDEKWLVVLTDGEFQTEVDPNAFFAQKDPSIQVMFLSIGPDAAGIRAQEDKGIYWEQTHANSEILTRITGICTRIFNSHRLTVDGSRVISFDVPMGELTVFAQGANVQINGIQGPDGTLYKSARTPVTVKYSEQAATNYTNVLVDRNLMGSIATFREDFVSGDYTLDVTGAETIEVYYKPNVEIAAYLTDSQGQEVTDLSALEAGEYTISFGFVKAGTKEKVPASSLLGEVSYQATVTNNGVTHDRSYASGDPILLEEGDLTIDVVARYLEYNTVSTRLDYSIYRDKALELAVTENPAFEVSVNGLPQDTAIYLEATLEGTPLTQEQWDRMGLPTVTFSQTPTGTMGDFQVEKTETPGLYRITPTIPHNHPSSQIYESCPFQVAYQEKFGEETWSGQTEATLQLQDNRTWIQRNRDLFISLLWLAVLLVVLLGYVPGIKKYLPKRLKRRPTIHASPNLPGEDVKEYTGELVVSLPSTLIPYIPQRGILRMVPKNVFGVPKMALQGMGGQKMLLTNTRAFAGLPHITFNGIPVPPGVKKNLKLTSAVSVRVETEAWEYSSQPNMGKK